MSAFDLLAVPAHPKPAAVTQPDGSTIKLILRGDEFQHWHEDAAGYTILKDAASGFWLYASLDSKGVLAATSLVVGRDNPAKAGLAQHLKPTSTVKLTPAAKKARQLAPAASRTVITHGTMKNLVILVQFPDLKGNYTKADVEAALNTPGYAVDGAHGSVQDYYREASGNQLTIESVVTDWVTLDHSYKYYGTNDSSGNDLRPQEMVQDAIAKLAATKFDFTTVDGDNDGWVDGLTIIHAGRGEEQTGNDPNYIYAHEWNLNTPVTYGGKKLQDYLAVAEQRGWDNDPSSWGLFRIGGFCHEMGHFLGLPDLYDYTYTSEGVGNFCLMSGGLWNGDNGTYPSHPSAYCKKLLGWVVPTVVSNTGIYNVPQVESVPVIYQLSGNFAATEYFLIENRQGVGFDTGLPGSSRGLLIWHVDETIADNNNRNHYMVGLEEANGARDLANSVDSGDDDDYFRSGNKTQFTATTTPNNKSYSSVVLGLDITNVSATASNMTFSLKGPPPTEGFVFFRNATSSKIFAPLNTPGLATPSTVTLATYPNLRLALYYGDVGITNENQLLGRVAANGLLTSNLATDTNGIITMTATAGIYSDAGPATVGFKTPTTNAATFQVRAWNGGFGATWEAFQNNPDKTNGTFYGKTALFTFAPGVGTPKTLYADGTLPYFQLQSLFVDTTPPGITNQPASQTVMLGSNVTFQVNSIGVVPLSYQWYFNPGALLPGATNSFLTLNRVQVAQAGDYYVVVSNRYGAATSDLAHLTVITTPPEITNKPVSQTVTAGSNVVFQVNA
ncbi:MAG: M6 family metalloprotease domain-containing protein, partial [Verrucomicrobiota bacterium]